MRCYTRVFWVRLGAQSTNVSILVDQSAFFNNYAHNYTEALVYADKALDIDPNYTVALTNKGSALYDQGKYEEAIQYYDKALAIDPNDKDVLKRKQTALSHLGQ